MTHAIKFIQKTRKWSAGKNHKIVILTIPKWVREELDIKGGEVVEVIIRKVSPYVAGGDLDEKCTTRN